MKNRILIIGGDKRQFYLKRILSNKGFECAIENADAENLHRNIKSATVIILPVPVSTDGKYFYSDNPLFKIKLCDVVYLLSKGQIVIGGVMQKEYRNTFKEKGVRYYDITKIGFFMECNALLTAQGALRMLLNTAESSLTGKKILVTGFGKVSDALSVMLSNLNCDVFIVARNKEQLIKAQLKGFKAMGLSELGSVIESSNYIFNTVPAVIFSEKDIGNIKPDAVYFELASKPYGADKTHFEKLNKNYLLASGLPGKYVPESAAELIAHTVESIIQGDDLFERET